MRAVIQRVSRASVQIDTRTVASMGPGLLVLVAAGGGDDEPQADWLAAKIPQLRIFADDRGRMNRSLLEVGGEMIAVSQFTLFGDCRKGRRPSFVGALDPVAAARLVERFIAQVRAQGITCGAGEFGAHMRVELVNDGPVTLLLDSVGKTGFTRDA